MTQIVDLVIQRLTTYLKQELSANIPTSDKSRVNLVKAYRFQADPLEQGVSVYITGGDPNVPTHRDARVSAREMEDLGMNIPIGEIGDGHFWWRRGRVVLNCYFITSELLQDPAALAAHNVLGRALYFTERAQVSDLVDSFGEQAHMIAVYANTFLEGGGPPNQYIWRGEIYWQVLTSRPM